MNSPTQPKFVPNSVPEAGAAEETLRIIARLPAPEGLEDRVREALVGASGTASVLPWPSELRHRWVRSAVARGGMAAAIVLVVGGGSWRVYSHVHPVEAPKVVVMPRIAAPGGFSSAGAMRTPQTLNGPVLAHPVTPKPDHASAQAQSQLSLAKKAQKTSKAVVPTKAQQ